MHQSPTPSGESGVYMSTTVYLSTQVHPMYMSTPRLRFFYNRDEARAYVSYELAIAFKALNTGASCRLEYSLINFLQL